jgi:paraquat-inducible protein B
LLERLPQAQLERGESQAEAYLRRMVTSDGLRGQLRTASLVTGQRYVAFDYFPRAGPARVDWAARRPQLPVVPSVLPSLEEKLAAILDKVDALPMKETVADARGVMQEARLAFASVHDLAQDVDQKALPGFVATMNNARNALDSAQRMLDGAATLVGEDAPAQRELRAALQEMTRAARAFRALSDSIERHPESVLYGREARSMSP